jgi:hypothetical protein
MTGNNSSDALQLTCATTPSLDEVARIVARLRAAGARVINSKGEDLRPADLEEAVREGLL